MYLCFLQWCKNPRPDKCFFYCCAKSRELINIIVFFSSVNTQEMINIRYRKLLYFNTSYALRKVFCYNFLPSFEFRGHKRKFPIENPSKRRRKHYNSQVENASCQCSGCITPHGNTVHIIKKNIRPHKKNIYTFVLRKVPIP